MTVAPEEEWGIELLVDTTEAEEIPFAADGIEVGVGSSFSDHVTQDVRGVEVDFGVPGPPGPSGADIAPQRSYQFTSSATWVIEHNLNKRPAVMLFLNEDITRPIYTDFEYVDSNIISVEWTQPESGWAYLQ